MIVGFENRTPTVDLLLPLYGSTAKKYNSQYPIGTIFLGSNTPMLCSCDYCGNNFTLTWQNLKKKLIGNHYCFKCRTTTFAPMKRPEVKAKCIANGNFGRNTPEYKENQRQRMLGSNNPMYGKPMNKALKENLIKRIASGDCAKSLQTEKARRNQGLAMKALGENHPSRRPEFKDKMSTRVKKLWENDEFRKAHIERMLGDNNPVKKPENRIKQLEGIRKPENKAKYSGDNSPSKRPEVREKMSKSRTKNMQNNKGARYNRGKIGYFFSTKNGLQNMFYRSSYELKAYIILEKDDDVISYKREPFSIPYEFDGLKKRTLPDILVNRKTSGNQLIEVKPEGLKTTKKNQIKIAVIENYAKQNNMAFQLWTEKELEISDKAKPLKELGL